MDPGVRSPLLDFFRRGEVSRDIRLTAAQGALAPRALEQLSLLLILIDDGDEEIAQVARKTLDAIPPAPIEAFLGRGDVPSEMRSFFAARGIAPTPVPSEREEPFIEVIETGDDAIEAPADEPEGSRLARLASMSVMQKMKIGMRGTREERAVLIRDPNRIVAAAVLSSPKLTETEVEVFARMANVAEDVLRVIGMNRNWLKNYTIVSGLIRNPKTPVAISMNLMNRLNERDMKLLAFDRNVPEPLRVAARKKTTKG
jgi:hypothetical protein